MNSYFDNVTDSCLALISNKTNLSQGAEYSVTERIVENCAKKSHPRGKAFHRLLYVDWLATFQ